jgi:hypothetical protein
MAEKTVIVDIDIKADDIKSASDAMAKARAETIAFNKELNSLKDAQKENSALFKVGAISADEYAKRQTDIKTKTSEVSKGLRESNKEYQNNKTVVDAANGSNEQMRARLSLLTKQYNGLSKEQRENTDEGKKLGATIKTVSDKLKENEKAVGDNRRNVGNYGDALKGLAGNLNIAGVNVGGMVDQLKKQKAALTAAAAAQKASAVATGTGTAALNIFKIALASTGIGLLIVALGALVAYFNSTKRGVEQLDRGLAAIKATVSVLTDRMSQLGEALTKVFSGDFAGAAEQAKGAFKGITEEITKESKAALELEGRMQKLRDAERELTVEVSKRKAEVAELQLIAEDETKTFKERSEAIKKANKIQSENMKSELDLQKERVEIIEQQLALGENLEEDEQKLAEERAKLGEIEARNIKKLRSLVAKENSIRKQEHAVYVKDENEKRKLTEEQVKAEKKASEERAKIREDFRKEQLTDIEARKENAFNKANELRAAGEKEKSIQSFLSQELKEIHRDEQDAILNAKLKRLEDEASAARFKIQTEIQDEQVRKAALLQIESELAEAKQQELDLEIQNYTASTEMMAIVDEERNAELLLQKAEIDAQVVDLDNQKTALLEENAVKLAETRKNQEREALGAAQGGLGVISNIVDGLKQQAESNISAIEEQAKAAGKTDAEINAMTKRAKKEAHELQVAAAVVQTLQAAISAYSSASATPIIGPYLGPIAAAAALAFGFANVSKMKQEKFSEGGVAQGPSHAQGGIPFTVAGHGGYEMEGNEIILTKGVYQDPVLRQQASILNQLGGGKSLVPGTYMASGGIASPTFAARSASNNQNAVLESQIAQLGDRIAEMQPVVRVSDINRINQQTVRVQQSADL